MGRKYGVPYSVFGCKCQHKRQYKGRRTDYSVVFDCLLFLSRVLKVYELHLPVEEQDIVDADVPVGPSAAMKTVERCSRLGFHSQAREERITYQHTHRLWP